ncbi:MAG: PQQ-dependent sugar dehydrogenase [Pseudomonadota bacterium]
MSGTVFLEANAYSVSESDDAVRVTIRRTGDLSQPVVIEYGLDADTATVGVDFLGIGGTVTMPAGADRAVVSVPILDEDLSEPTETFTLSLIEVSSGALQFPRTARIDILDDENPVTEPPEPPLVSDFDVTQEVLTTTSDAPVALEFVPGEPAQVLIAEKGGQVRVFDLETETYQQADFLDISDQVNSARDRGLLDIAFHPDFENEPYVYAFYVVDPPETAGRTGNAGREGEGNRYAYVSRFEVREENGALVAVEGSEVVLVGGAGRSLSDISGGGAVNSTSRSNADLPASDIDPDTGAFRQDYIKVDSTSHAGGSLAFGPDGALYVSIGDGTSFNYADPRTLSVQSLDALAGKILRIDPLTGDGLADNPFVTNAGGDLSQNAAKVYQLGLRNPFSMGFDDDGRLFSTDTGWFSFEEVNAGGAGANSGWPFFEGGDNGTLVRAPRYRDLPEAQAFYDAVDRGEIDITAPYRGFAHANSAPGFQVQAITGADDVLTGNAYPDALRNHYFFSDITQGELYAVDVNDRRDLVFLEKEADGVGPAHIALGPDGFLYFADVVTNKVGRYRIERDGETRVFDDPTRVQKENGTGDTFVVDGTADAFIVNRTNDGTGVIVYTADRADDRYDLLFGFDTVSFTDRSIDLAGLFGDGTPDVEDIPGVVQSLTGIGDADRFIIDGVASDYTVGPTNDSLGTIVYTRADDNDDYDLLFGFEEIVFRDQVVDLRDDAGGGTIIDDPSRNESLTGTSGIDTFRIDADADQFVIGRTNDGQGAIVYTRDRDDDVFDLLFDFEFVAFNDATVDLADIFGGGGTVRDDPGATQILTGVGEADRFVIAGASNDYRINPTNDGTGTIVYTADPTDDAYDLLFGYEEVSFSDRTITLGDDGLPI